MNCTRGRAPGQWWPLDLGDGRRSAKLYCPSCAKPCSMVNHTIDPTGNVSPSFVECADNVRCGTFHQNLVLIGWPEFLAKIVSR